MANRIGVNCGDDRVFVCETAENVTFNSNVLIEKDGVVFFGVYMRKVEPDAEVTCNFVKVATPEDYKQHVAHQEECAKDKIIVKQQIQIFGLQMKVIKVIRSFDNKKLLIIYTANERVDFRNLVKSIASLFRMRIEMRQISERDEVKYLGGCGVCGQQLCCSRYLTQLNQVSIKMAKIQGQALTPNKVSGVCGKLMCCLQYEYEQYRAVLSTMPALGSKVETPNGDGVVMFNDALRKMVTVKLTADNNVQKFNLSDIKFIKKEANIDEE